MNAPLSKSSESTNWLHLYRAAILEMDPSKLSQQVAEAENALTQRERELFQKTEDNIEEKRALDNAMYFLRTLRKTMECNPAGPHWGDWPCEGCVSTTAGHFNLISRPARS